MNDEIKPFLVSYRHDGQEWNVELMARNFADAKDRMAKLSLGRVEGVLVAKVPSALGPFAVLTAFLRNTLKT